MLDVVVTCLPRGPTISKFPQVRGYYLAEHLSRAGVRAVFRHLPLDGLECKVVISSEYQSEMPSFERRLAGPLSAIKAERWFNLIAYSLRPFPDHFSRQSCEWFAARGGALCHLPSDALLPYEHWIGLGVDRDAVPAAAAREHVLFDFPGSAQVDEFDTRALEAIRAAIPDVRLVGSGRGDAPIRDAFDEWIRYGLPHRAYTAAAFSNCFAFVPGTHEAMGLSAAEAQVAGACIVHSKGQIKNDMLVDGASVRYDRGDIASLVRALAVAVVRGRDGDAIRRTLVQAIGVARGRDGDAIRRAALERFDYAAVARRTLRAIGLT